MAQVLENTSIISKKPSTTKALTKAIAQAQSRSIHCSDNNNKGDGRIQIKFVISKKELKQMVRSIGLERNGRRSSDDNHRPAAAGLEELLQALRKKHNEKAEFVSRRWQPKLQSIPEEL